MHFIKRYVYVPTAAVRVSGIHWNVAFGSVGNLIFRRSEFAGAKSCDGALISSGVLESGMLVPLS